MKESELLELKREIDEGKEEKARLKGVLQSKMEQAKKDWNCETIEELQTKLEDLKKKKIKLDDQLSTGLEELEELMKEDQDES